MTTTRKLQFAHKQHADFIVNCLRAEHTNQCQQRILPDIKVERSIRGPYWIVTFEIINQHCRDVELWLSGLNTGIAMMDEKVI